MAWATLCCAGDKAEPEGTRADATVSGHRCLPIALKWGLEAANVGTEFR